jgi:uncharacterized membrane protein YdfJ with MMPL/SSD domain
VLVDALTTILGFGALMVASHKGLESLGRVLTLGVTTCTLTALVFLPAVLTILRPATDAEQGRPDEEAAADGKPLGEVASEAAGLDPA